MADKKYFWLKLKRDFFKRADIRVIEEMPNGKDYILFYLKLLCESIDHEGCLRFNEQIPYNDNMLATVTNTNIDIVRASIKVFTELGMMDIMDDGTFFMNEVEKMIGSAVQDEHTRESTRLRVQAHRERQKQAMLEQKRYSNVICNGEIDIESESEINKESESDKEEEEEFPLPPSVPPPRGETVKFVPPTLEEVSRYLTERGSTIDPELFWNYYESVGWMRGKNKIKDWKRCVSTWERNEKKKQQKPKTKFQNFDERTYNASDLTALEEAMMRH